jgi:rubredoxin
VTEATYRKTLCYDCPCGYRYDPEVGDQDAGYAPGTPLEELPEALTCPRCQRARNHFRKREISKPAE